MACSTLRSAPPPRALPGRAGRVAALPGQRRPAARLREIRGPPPAPKRRDRLHGGAPLRDPKQLPPPGTGGDPVCTLGPLAGPPRRRADVEGAVPPLPARQGADPVAANLGAVRPTQGSRRSSSDSWPGSPPLDSLRPTSTITKKTNREREGPLALRPQVESLLPRVAHLSRRAPFDETDHRPASKLPPLQPPRGCHVLPKDGALTEVFQPALPISKRRSSAYSAPPANDRGRSNPPKLSGGLRNVKPASGREAVRSSAATSLAPGRSPLPERTHARPGRRWR